MSNPHPWLRNDDDQQLIQQSQHLEDFEDEQEENESKKSDDRSEKCKKGKKKKKLKQLLLVPFRKLGGKSKKFSSNEIASAVPSPNPSSDYDYDEYYQFDVVQSGGYWCCLNPSSSRMAPPARRQQQQGSPKKPTYYDFVKSLLEKNDFYSKECNVHQDIRSPAGS